MKKKDNASLADAFRKLSAAAAEIAEALESTSKKEDTAEAPVKEPAKQKAAAPVNNISFEDVRTILAAKAGEGFRSEVKEILSKHNASCLSDLESHPEDFAALLKEAEAIGNE